MILWHDKRILITMRVRPCWPLAGALPAVANSGRELPPDHDRGQSGSFVPIWLSATVFFTEEKVYGNEIDVLRQPVPHLWSWKLENRRRAPWKTRVRTSVWARSYLHMIPLIYYIFFFFSWTATRPRPGAVSLLCPYMIILNGFFQGGGDVWQRDRFTPVSGSPSVVVKNWKSKACTLQNTCSNFYVSPILLTYDTFDYIKYCFLFFLYDKKTALLYGM